MKPKMSLFICFFAAMTLFLGASSAVANDSGDSPTSSADIKERVMLLAEDGNFANDGVVRALNIHLTAVHHFEQQNEAEKVVKHMKGFKRLLDHHKANEFISEHAYNKLSEKSDSLINVWQPLTIVRDGSARAVVLITENADEQMNKAADTLAEYVRKSTGAELPIMTESDLLEAETNYDDHVRIYIGNHVNNEDPHISEGLHYLDDQGFLIHPHGNKVTIVGPTVWGTLNGVYDLLERYVGVRWLMAGPKGEDVPERTDLFVPKKDVRDEPAFTFRNISPANGSPEANGTEARRLLYEWAQRNRLQGAYNRPIEFHHNLHSLFPVEKYAESHPEFYPNGDPPAPGEETHWQPCFTVEGTVDAAVSGIIEYFAENPNKKGFSLGVNDSKGYCETDPSHPDYPDKNNSVGLPDMSDIYYAWVNEVVEQVLDVYPDKWFGLLAYDNVMDPPSFDLHPRVVPFITKDRLAWVDEEIRAEGHEQMDEWNEVAAQVSWYDYMYGVQYNIPRVYPHHMAENYQYAIDHNVFGNYAEMYHNAGDGPKAWVSAKLQWNPDQDVDALLDEWYERAVGPEAAPYLEEYYDLWERFWMERIPGSTWFETGKHDTYLRMVDPSYLNLVTDEDVAESKRLLQFVVDKAVTDEQKTRAEILQRAFEFYEASVVSYPKPLERPDNEAEALAMLQKLEDTIDERIQLAKTREQLKKEFNEEPLLAFIGNPRGDWTGWNSTEFAHLRDYMEEQEPDGGPVTDKVNELANRHEPSKARDFARMLQNTDLNSSATVNASFEEGNTDAESWNFWNPPQVGNIQRVEGIAQTGNASVLLENTERAGVYQTAPAHSGLIASQVYYYTPPGTETEGSILLVIEGFSADGEKLVTYLSNQVPLADTVGEWASVSLLEEIPQTVNGKEVSEVLVNAQIFDAVGVQVYQDDLGVYQNAEEESPAKMMLADVTSGPLMSGEPVFAKSSKDATLYLVPEGTEETKKAIEGGAHSPDRSVGRKTPGLQLNSCQF